MDATADCAKQTRETETSGNMTNRNSLLGRSKPSERLTREEITALDKATVPPAPATAGDGQPKPGQRLARCGRCKVVLVLGGG